MEEGRERDQLDNFESDIARTFEAFHTAKQALLDYVAQSMAYPNYAEVWEGFKVLADDTADLFGHVTVSLIDQTPGPDDAHELLCDAWFADDAERVSELRKLTGTDIFEFADREVIAYAVDSVFEDAASREEIQGLISKHYAQFLANDINTFLGILYKRQSETEIIYPHERDVEIFDQSESVFALVEYLETLASSLNPDYEEELDDGVQFAKSFIDLGGEITSGFSFTAQRERNVDDDGNDEVITNYHMTSDVQYQFAGFTHLPSYLQEHILSMIDESQPELERSDDYEEYIIGFPFERQDLVDEDTTFLLTFEFNTDITTEGSFWPHFTLEFTMNGYEIALPEFCGEELLAANDTSMSPEEAALFSGILSEAETEAISDIIHDYESRLPGMDIIHKMSEQVAMLNLASTEERIKLAQGVARELRRVAVDW